MTDRPIGRMRQGFTLIEVVTSIGLMAIGILTAAVAIILLSRNQSLGYKRILTANLAMVIGHYRATDMVQKAAINLSQASPTDVGTANHLNFWNSLSYSNTNTVWHGYPFSDTSTRTQAGVAGTNWTDQCPLFEPWNNTWWDNPTSGNVTPFSNADRFAQVQPPGSYNSGSLKFVGGSSAEQNFCRLYRVNIKSPADLAALAGGSLSGTDLGAYNNIVVSFSEPSVPPASMKINARFLVATFWEVDHQVDFSQRPQYYCPPDYYGPYPTCTFLGRYLILDSLVP